MARRGYHQWPRFMILLCSPLRKDKECTKLIAVMHVIPVRNTEGVSPSTARVVELVVMLDLGSSAVRRVGSSPTLRTGRSSTEEKIELIVKWRNGRRAYPLFRGEVNRLMWYPKTLVTYFTGSSPVLITMLGSSQMNLGRYRASLREIEKKPVHSQVWYKVGSSPMEGRGCRVAPCIKVRFLD
jgi:hypothetical protein